MTAPEIIAQYQGRIRDLQLGLDQARFHGTLAATLLAIAVALFLMLSLFAIRQQMAYLWPSIPIPLAAVAARRLRLHRQSRNRIWRLRRFYDGAVQRMQGNWVGKGANGAEFDDPSHIYARDLTVFGEGSLFELLCTARTSIGRHGLAKYLLQAPVLEETLSRQEAIRELEPRVDLREEVALLGEFEFSESRWEIFAEWLDAPPLTYSKSIRVATLVTSALFGGLLVGGLSALVPWTRVAIWIAPLMAFHSVIGLLFLARVRQMMEWHRSLSLEIPLLRKGLQLLEEQSFQSAKLRGLADQVRNSSKSVRKLERMLKALNERNKEWFYLPALSLLFATQLCWAIEHWRIKRRLALRVWLDVWAEFEALNALANYAYENADNTFPEFSSEETKFEAEGLGHPLIVEASCVRNDIALNRQSAFYLVSGSNMSGKSTLLRAIGLNAVLAFAGAPVRAQHLRLSRLSVCASLTVMDSLLSAKSKFMVEVDRLRLTLQAAIKEGPVLFLIDEIFAGTNSRDRRVAAEAVVRTLVSRGAIGALSTHDLALGEIGASEELGGVNVHMGSRDGRDPMDFDYLLKPGVTNETNALAIARMAGVPV